MDTRKAPRFLVVALFLGFFAATALIPARAAADAKTEAAAQALQKKAMMEDYLFTEFAKAQEKLEQALTMCGTDKCSAPVRAQLHRDLGVVQIGGQLDKEKGAANFAEALKLDPSIQLNPDLKTNELEEAFEQAKKGGGAAAGGATTTETSEGPAGDFTHTPVAAQQIRTPIPVYVEYPGEMQLVKVIVRYKGFGMTDWKRVELQKMGDKAWGGELPCADVQQGTTQYYLQGFDANNDPVATSGNRNNPYVVPVQRQPVAEPPHLPGRPAPKQCPAKGDCPPDFPGCKSSSSAGGGGSLGSFAGKEEGAYCEEDAVCASNKCEANKCTAPEKKAKFRKIWVGIWGAFDYSFVPTQDDVCKLHPKDADDPDKSALPLNTANYYCVNSDGSDYPYRPAGPGDNDPRKVENANLVNGSNDQVRGGGVFGNIRVMASLDYAITMNVLLGARLGYVLNTYPGQAAKDDGKTFPPIHLELRGTYLIGKDALTKKFAPYVFGAAGVSTFDAAVKVGVVELQGANKVPRSVDAWHIAGPAFFSVGGGVRAGFSDAFALMGGLRANFAFGNAFAPSVGPELGILMGF